MHTRGAARRGDTPKAQRTEHIAPLLDGHQVRPFA